MIIVCGCVEGFTSAKVSAAARRAWLQQRGATIGVSFQRCRGGYEMFAWESQIDACRDFGAGAARAAGRPVHRFDMRRTAYSNWQRQQEAKSP